MPVVTTLPNYHCLMPMACQGFAYWMGDENREERKKESKAVSSIYGRDKNGIHNKHDNPIKLKIVYFFPKQLC